MWLSAGGLSCPIWLWSYLLSAKGMFKSSLVLGKRLTVVLYSCLWEACSAVVQYGGQEKGQPFVTVMRVWRPLPSSRVIWGGGGARVLLNAATCTVVCCMVQYFLMSSASRHRLHIFISIGLVPLLPSAHQSRLLGSTFRLIPCTLIKKKTEFSSYIRKSRWDRAS